MQIVQQHFFLFPERLSWFWLVADKYQVIRSEIASEEFGGSDWEN